MARSVWKGPFVEESLMKKVDKQKLGGPTGSVELLSGWAALASRPAADPRRRFLAKVGLALLGPLPQCVVFDFGETGHLRGVVRQDGLT
jgi:hypothetical protein